jgi:GR25 family glycosyltransferase involved in LPS biosynthesis
MITSYIISLKNPVNLIQEVKTYGFNPILIKGVRGDVLSLDEKIEETGDYLKATTIPNSVLGCAAAHLKTWKTFLSTNEPYCVIFEDDAVFEPNFKHKFDLCFKHTPFDFDIFSNANFSHAFLFNSSLSAFEKTNVKTNVKARYKYLLLPLKCLIS